jgi:ABC-type multidrug transport system fused ATPase/permease subunit
MSFSPENISIKPHPKSFSKERRTLIKSYKNSLVHNLTFNIYNYIMLYIITLVLGGIASMFLPWWVVAPLCFCLCAWKAETGLQAFSTSAAAITTLWVAYATFQNATSVISMAEQVGNLFAGFIPGLEKLPKTGLMFSVLTLIASNVAGFAGLAGFQVRDAIRK